MIVTATLVIPSVLSLDIYRETDSRTVLEEGFRIEHFEFFDLITSTLFTYELFLRIYDPSDSISLYNLIELYASVTRV